MNRQQFGATLIELLISMVLSLVLIAGIGSLFVQMQQSGKTQQALNSMMDDSRYVQELLQKEIRRTGSLRSPSDTDGRSDKVFLTAVAPFAGTAMSFAAPVAPEGEYIKGVKNGTNDELIIRYQLIDTLDLSDLDPTNTSSPCTKDLMLNPDENPAIDVHVVAIYLYLSGGSLMCQGRRDWIDTVNFPGVLTLMKSQGATELIGNVERMTAVYGVDSDANHAADYYTDATSVPVTSWKDVVSVRLTLVLRSDEDNLVPTKVNYSIDGTSVTPSDKRLYRVFSTTIALRNQI